jgi:hypothetical protein
MFFRKILHTRFVLSYFFLYPLSFKIIIIDFVLMFFYLERPTSKPFFFIFHVLGLNVFFFFLLEPLNSIFLGLILFF